MLLRGTRLKEFKGKKTTTTINGRCTELIREQMSLRDLETQIWTWAESEDGDAKIALSYIMNRIWSVRSDLRERGEEKLWKRRGIQISQIEIQNVQ